MDLLRLVISTWAGVAVILETGPSTLDPATRMHRRSDNIHLAEVDSMAEVEDGVEVILASAVDLQTTATHSDLGTDHRLPQGGAAYLAVTGTTGARRGVKTTAGSTVMIVSASLIVSGETLQLAGLIHVHLLLTNKCRRRNLQLSAHRLSSLREMTRQCEDRRQHPCLESKSLCDVICRLKMYHRLCLYHQTIFWLDVSSHRPLVMDLVLLHHHLPHHKFLLSVRYLSSLSRTVDLRRMCGKHPPKIVLHQHPRSRRFRLRLRSNPSQQPQKHSSQHRLLLLREHPEHSKMQLRPLPESLSVIEHLQCRKPGSRLHRSIQLLLGHGLSGQMTEQADSMLQQQLLRDLGSPVLSNQK